MFYPFLDLLACPACAGELVLLFPEESPRRTSMRMPPARRASPAGSIVGPLPGVKTPTALGALLAARAAAPDTGRREVEVVSGLLVCPDCSRWYPVRDGLPELLPDHLRSTEEDGPFIQAYRKRAEEAGLAEVFRLISSPSSPVSGPKADAEGLDPGAHYKRAEMSVTSRPLPEGFFGPAAVAPFNPYTPLFSLDLIDRFANTAPLLSAPLNGLIFDLGCGYAWTTEWLVRLGYQAVGVDICRDYILAGLPRLADNVPHLLVADVENIPLRSGLFDAVLSFDAFHHVPGRKKALAGLGRILKPGSRIVMIEPGPDHEYHPRSVAVMKEHGILERGVDPAAVKDDLSETELGSVVSHPLKSAHLVLLTIEKAGEFRTDSRSPRQLIAQWKVQSPSGPLEFDAGLPVAVDCALENSGDTLWLKETPDGRGAVKIGVKLLDKDGHPVNPDYARIPITRDLAPFEGIRMRLALPPIETPGRYILEFDGLDEGFLWFKDFDYRPYQVGILVKQGREKAAAAATPLPAARELSFYAFSRRNAKPNRWTTVKNILRTEGPVSLMKIGWRRLGRVVRRGR